MTKISYIRGLNPQRIENQSIQRKPDQGGLLIPLLILGVFLFIKNR